MPIDRHSLYSPEGRGGPFASRAPDRAGITDPEKSLDGDLHWHDLRHECASRYADHGMDARHIQMLLGHADLKTAERYLNSDTKRSAEAMKRAAGGASRTN